MTVGTVVLVIGGLLILVGFLIKVVQVANAHPRFARPNQVNAETPPTRDVKPNRLGAVLTLVGAALVLVGACLRIF